jgi:predicted transposase/invertase (TIGR01784 family)
MTDHDRLFKELIGRFFVDFLDLFLPEVRAFVQADSIQFLDKEIFTDVTSGERMEPDLIARVRFRGLPAYFIIHIENQSQAQKGFGRRLFRYFSRIHDHHNLPVYPIVIFSFDSPRRPQPDFYRVEFPNKVVLDFRFDVVQLNRLSWRDFVKKKNPVAAALMAKMNIAQGERARVKLECLRLLLTLKLNKARMKLISGFIDNYLDLNREESKEFEAEVRELAVKEKEHVMEIMTSWKKEGLRQGLAQGRVEAVRGAVVDILEARFNRVPAAVKRALKAVEDQKQLKLLLRQAATVVSIKEFAIQLTAL